MRKLMWFSLGFLAACGAGAYCLQGTWILLLGLICLLGVATALLLKGSVTRLLAALCLGGLVGSVWFWGYDCLYLSGARAYDGERIFLTVTASDYSYSPRYGQAFDGRTELDGKTYRIRTYLNEETPVSPGDVIEGTFLLRCTAGTQEQEPTYHQGQGIFLLAYQREDVLHTEGEPAPADYPACWRQRLLALIDALFPQDTSAFAKALLLGDSSGLSYTQDRAFQVSGIRHVIAVSGLHVSILFALIYTTFGQRPLLNMLIGVPLLAIFAAMAGFTPSIVRACIMQGLMLLSMLALKEYDPPTALAFSALVIVAINPMAITSVSLQLSAGCMVGIFAFGERLKAYFLSFGKLKSRSKGKSIHARLIRWLTGSVSVTLSAMVVTTPLCVCYFGMVSLIGILSNLLTLWVVSFIFYGILLSCAASLLWLPLGQGIAWLTAWPIRYVLYLSRVLAEFPLAAVYTQNIYIAFWLIFSYVLLGLFFLLKRRNPGIAAAGIAVSLCICICLSWLEPRLGDLRVSVIDVGQGQSVLIRQGKTHYLIDCGGERRDYASDQVLNFLLSQGVFRLDGVILTHYDTDHAGSVPDVLSVVPSAKIYMPDIQDSNGIRQRIEAAFPKEIQLISEEAVLEADSGKITLYPANPTANDNESGMCVLFQGENCDILITGDRSGAGERMLLKQAQLPRLELLVAGHHGSHLSTSFDLLLQTRPQVAVISVGGDNPYGHPREETLERLDRFGCKILRTDQLGTITFRR